MCDLICFRVYCKYHYLEGHETPNPEVEIWKFLVLISKNEIDITKKQYSEKVQNDNFDMEGKLCSVVQ